MFWQEIIIHIKKIRNNWQRKRKKRKSCKKNKTRKTSRFRRILNLIRMKTAQKNKYLNYPGEIPAIVSLGI